MWQGMKYYYCVHYYGTFVSFLCLTININSKLEINVSKTNLHPVQSKSISHHVIYFLVIRVSEKLNSSKVENKVIVMQI